MCRGSSLGVSEGLRGASGRGSWPWRGGWRGGGEAAARLTPGVFQISGKWFITAFMETEGLTGDRVFTVTFSVLSDTHVWVSMTHR